MGIKMKTGKKKVVYFVGHYGGFYISLLHKAAFYADAEAYYIYVRTYSSSPVNEFMDRISQRQYSLFGKVICMDESIFWGLGSEEDTRQHILKHYDEIFENWRINIKNDADLYMFFDEFNSMGIYLNDRPISGNVGIITTALERLVSYVDMYLFNEIDGRRFYSALQRKCKTLEKDGSYVDQVIRTFQIDNIKEEEFLKENRKRKEALDHARTYTFFDLIEAVQSLSENQIKELQNIFECDSIQVEDKAYNLFLLSSNFTAFKAQTSENDFIYGNQILADYCIGNQDLAIKPHPRADLGKAVWERVFENSIYVPSYLPAEYLETLHLKINTLLSTGSAGSGYVSRIAKQKFNMGRSYWWNFRYMHKVFAALNLASYAGYQRVACMGIPEEMAEGITQCWPQLRVFQEVKKAEDPGKLPENTMLMIRWNDTVANNPTTWSQKALETLFSGKRIDYMVVFLNLDESCAEGSWQLSGIKNQILRFEIIKKKEKDIVYGSLNTEQISIYMPDVTKWEKMQKFYCTYSLKNAGLSIQISSESQGNYKNAAGNEETFLMEVVKNMNASFCNMAAALNTVICFTDERIRLIRQFDAYILELRKLQRTIIISVRDTPGLRITPNIAKNLQSLGVQQDLLSKHWHSYVAIIHGQELLYEKLDQDHAVFFETRLFDTHIIVKSAALKHGNISKIEINGKDYSMNMRGFNIVVYDCEKKKLIDSVGFDTHALGIPCYRDGIWVV